MKIAIFGGSFDPIHTEHIYLAQAALRELALDKLFVMPAYAPPHKKGKALSSDEDRLEMCRLAFQGEDKVEVSDYEIKRQGTSYTYLTCRHFREIYPTAEIFWLVGADMLRDFPTWKNPEDILENVTLAACGREAKTDSWWKMEQEEFLLRFGKRFRVFTYNGAAVSSTKIRVLAGAGMRLTPFVTEDVERYIFEKALYAIPYADEALSLEKETRKAHSLRVAELAAARGGKLGIPERKAIEAALFHDCAKNLSPDSEHLQGFVLPTEWGEVPAEVAHQFAGAYVAERSFKVTDGEILDAVKYHTSGRPNMGELEKLIFLADMLEEERRYQGVEELRSLFWKGENLDECLEEALRQTLLFLRSKGGDIYSLTVEAYEYYKERSKK